MQNAQLCPVDGTRFWAVLVGIDAYAEDETLRLRGACADALAMHEYLTADLRVPPGDIQLLITEDSQRNAHPPTRDHILNALYDLRDNPDIQRGDNILFYFAGRGTLYSAPLVEALCPADRGCMVEGSATPVYDISDRELSTIFQEITAAKGDCMTVITDSCHTHGRMEFYDHIRLLTRPYIQHVRVARYPMSPRALC